MQPSPSKNRRSKVRRPNSRSLKTFLRAALLVALMAAVVAALAFSPRSLVRTTAQQASDKNQISEAALQQIQALLEEKESRTPAQRKIDSQLLYALKMNRGESIARGVDKLAVDVGADAQGDVVVDISAIVDDQLLSDLKKMGVGIISVVPEYHSIRASASLNQLEQIAEFQQVRFIQPKQEFQIDRVKSTESSTGQSAKAVSPNLSARAANVRANLLAALNSSGFTPDYQLSTGVVNTQGNRAHRADTARGVFNVDGSNIRIGVLSDGVDGNAASQASGDLPPTCSSLTPPVSEKCVQVVPGKAGSGAEGTAMLEIIHDLAPGAQLFFATANGGTPVFAQTIKDLRNIYNCDIIVDDIRYDTETPMQDGQGPLVVSNTNGAVVTQAVNDVTDAGALYFASQGNSGNLNDGQGGVYQGDFVSGGTIGILGGGTVHDFDSSAAVAQSDLITVSSTGNATLYWADPLGASTNDYDLFILNNALTSISGSSTNIQTGTTDPYETVGTASVVANNRIVVFKKTGAADRFFHVSTNRGRLSIATDGQTRGHSAAAGSNACAATNANIVAPNSFSAANSVETFSSDGPRRVMFQPDGTAYTPGNFSSTGGILRQKPDMTAADAVSVTGNGGFPTSFSGTSAAAPHAGAIAALLKSLNPGGITATQVRNAMTATAIDIEAAGVDRDSGPGIVMPYPALLNLGATGKAFLEPGTITATETCCNGNGVIERGEGASLTIPLLNSGVLNATGISATLTTSTPGVAIQNGASSYADLAPSATGSNASPLSFSLPINYPPDQPITFTLTLTYGNAWEASYPLTFTIPTGRFNITTTLDATTPPLSPSYPTSTTGTQTNRLFRDDPSSTCALAQPFPGTSAVGTIRYDSYTFTNVNGAAACVTVTLSTTNGNHQSAAYTGSFNPASLSTNYLADIGATSTAGNTRSYSFNVPNGGTVVVNVNEVTAGVGGTYTLQVTGLALGAAPTAAETSISGRIETPDGAPLEGVVVALGGPSSARTITDSEGRYTFSGLTAGEFYTVTPSRVSYTFSPANRSFSLTSNRTEAGFTAVPDAVVAANPIDTAEYFVRQQYVDFLGREPDGGGFSYWTSEMQQCGTDPSCLSSRRIGISAAFFMEREFQETGSFVYRLYKAAYGARPSYAQFTSDRGRIVGGSGLEASKAALADNFVTRAEFKAAYPDSMSNAAFVQKFCDTAGLFNNDAERAGYVNKLNNGVTRSAVLREMVESEALKTREYNPSFVTMEYFGYLKRDPDEAGFAFWLNVLNNREPNNYKGMVCAFITSAEYQKRFAAVVTHSNRECGQ